jgi:class 3 adenylate cyclase
MTQLEILDGAYLATAEMTDVVANHTIATTQLALSLTEAIERFNGHSACQVHLRVGLEAGPAMAPMAKKRKGFLSLIAKERS